YRQTGCPVVINTSFNLGWDPIVHTPREAYETFMASEIDVLCMGHTVLTKAEQPATVPAAAGDAPEALLQELWCSPCCQAELMPRDGRYACLGCGRSYACTEGIPQLFFPHDGFAEGDDVTEKVKAFYEETPFP